MLLQHCAGTHAQSRRLGNDAKHAHNIGMTRQAAFQNRERSQPVKQPTSAYKQQQNTPIQHGRSNTCRAKAASLSQLTMHTQRCWQVPNTQFQAALQAHITALAPPSQHLQLHGGVQRAAALAAPRAPLPQQPLQARP